MSIQPIVKHGVGQKKKGGTITISSEETEEAFIVTVADDGVGFDADVVITSVIGEGTTAKVIIPKSKGSAADKDQG